MCYDTRATACERLPPEPDPTGRTGRRAGERAVVTSRDVAASAGVSQATVSRVMSGSELVADETRRRVLAAMRRTGYQPNQAARSMRTRRSGTIGIVVADVLNPFYPAVIAAASRELNRRNRRMILWESDFGGERNAVEAIGQRYVDGVMFTTATAQSPPLKAALDAGQPTVLVNRTISGLPCDQVDSNNSPTSSDIARYFATGGHRRVGLITADGSFSTAALRDAGFRAGVGQAGLVLPEELVVDGGFTHQGGHAALVTMMTSPAPPTAVFCVNDLSALGALDAATSLRLRVPQDVWIAGYDDIDMASWEAFSLSSARQPIDLMIGLAVDLLLARIDRPSRVFQHYQFPTTFSVRRSTDNRPFVRDGQAQAVEPVLVREWPE